MTTVVFLLCFGLGNCDEYAVNVEGSFVEQPVRTNAGYSCADKAKVAWAALASLPLQSTNVEYVRYNCYNNV